eukprot:superscaffoldBa00009287_g23992
MPHCPLAHRQSHRDRVRMSRPVFRKLSDRRGGFSGLLGERRFLLALSAVVPVEGLWRDKDPKTLREETR